MEHLTPLEGMIPKQKGLLIIPCYNESESIPTLLDEVSRAKTGLDVLVINDGSTDRTADVVRAMDVALLNLPCNLGVGHAVQAGFQYGVEMGYDFIVRIDGDGQHPPGEISKLIEMADKTSADLIVGSRFGAGNEMISTRLRYVGILLLSWFLSAICKGRISDPTSGFWCIRRDLFSYFAKEFPTDYPEPEALAILRRQGYAYAEIPVTFRAREAGESSIKSWGTLYFAFKVGLAIVVDRLRPVNKVYAKRSVT